MSKQQLPVGTPVRYWPGARHGKGIETVTRTPVFMISNRPCVSVEGYPGGISLTHIERITTERPPNTDYPQEALL
jgi:hypothetical protein